MDTNSPQVPLPPQKPQKHSKLGIGSFISAIVALLFTSIFMFFGGLPLSFTHNVGDLILGFALGGLLATLVGIRLSIASVIQKGTSKMFGILGLVVSGLVLLSFCAYGIFLIWFLSGMY